MPTITRKLATIMFTHIVGYTALMGSDEDGAFETLRNNSEIHSNLVEQFNGTLIKEMGDGMLFSIIPVKYVGRCARTIQYMAKKELISLLRDYNFQWKKIMLDKLSQIFISALVYPWDNRMFFTYSCCK